VIEVQRIDYIRVPVTDMEQANHFYGEVLGLERNPTPTATPSFSTIATSRTTTRGKP
jgi:catechol 2,3-dioxygenase-like lactoylglutathione lyase family enzyme